MKSLLRFFQQYSVVLLFLILEVVALYLFFSRNRFQQSGFLTTANTMLGGLGAIESQTESYFSLYSENRLLEQENALLHEQIARYEAMMGETMQQMTNETAQTVFIPARVVHWFHRSRQPYLTIDKGKADSVDIGMGVISSMGIVGVTTAVTEHYSLVMPVINEHFKVNAMLKKQGYTGLLCWRGGSEHSADLDDVVQHIEVSVGDTVVTSALSALFVEGIEIGTVESLEAVPTDSYYDIKVRLSTDYRRLMSVYVIRQEGMEELKQLEK